MLKHDINVGPRAYGTDQGCISLVRAIHAACPSLAAKTIVALCPRVTVWISVCMCAPICVCVCLTSLLSGCVGVHSLQLVSVLGVCLPCMH